MVEASESCKVLLGNGGGKVGADHGIGVGWVTHHHYLWPGGLVVQFEGEREGGREEEGERGRREMERQRERGEGGAISLKGTEKWLRLRFKVCVCVCVCVCVRESVCVHARATQAARGSQIITTVSSLL